MCLAAQSKAGQRHVTQSNLGKYCIFAGESTVNILRTDALQMPLGEISGDVDLGFENSDVITVLDDLYISGYPVDHVVSATQESGSLVKLKAQSRPCRCPVWLPYERE
jgi:hypothetical protein